jgi:hypothetical protein
MPSRRAGKAERGRSLRQSLTGFSNPGSEAVVANPDLDGIVVAGHGASLSACSAAAQAEADGAGLDRTRSRGDRAL